MAYHNTLGFIGKFFIRMAARRLFACNFEKDVTSVISVRGVAAARDRGGGKKKILIGSPL